MGIPSRTASGHFWLGLGFARLSHGPAFRTASFVLAGLLVVLGLAGCSGNSTVGSPTASATPTPTLRPTPTPMIAWTAEPTPTPKWTPAWTWPGPTPYTAATRSELKSTCSDGSMLPDAAEYGGTVHPLVVVDKYGQLVDSPSLPINYRRWTTPIQLVACIEELDRVETGTGCWYSGADSGELMQQAIVQRVQIVVAATGETLKSKVFSGHAAPLGGCPEMVTSLVHDVAYPDVGEENSYAEAAANVGG